MEKKKESIDINSKAYIKKIKSYEIAGYLGSSISISSHLVSVILVYSGLGNEKTILSFQTLSLIASIVWLVYAILIKRIPILISSISIIIFSFLIIIYLTVIKKSEDPSSVV